jgi:ABC-type glycerol-3-phosphate transport system permease component
MACLEIGYRIGRHSSEKYPESAHEGIGVIEAAVFALLGLLLGFSFAGGTSRLDTKRQLIVHEANAIGTAYLRLDELPVTEQPELRRLFREYLDARLSVYEKLPDLKAAEQEVARAARLQQEIWSRAVSASRGDPTQNAARLLLPALNEMIDISTTRTIAMHTYLPSLIFTLLTGVALVSGLLAGYAMAKRKSRSWLHLVLYALVVSVTIYAVLDLEYSRFGLIRIDAADKALHQLRDSIH